MRRSGFSYKHIQYSVQDVGTMRIKLLLYGEVSLDREILLDRGNIYRLTYRHGPLYCISLQPGRDYRERVILPLKGSLGSAVHNRGKKLINGIV